MDSLQSRCLSGEADGGHGKSKGSFQQLIRMHLRLTHQFHVWIVSLTMNGWKINVLASKSDRILKHRSVLRITLGLSMSIPTWHQRRAPVDRNPCKQHHFASPVKQKPQSTEFRDKRGDRIPTSTGEREHWPAHFPKELYTADHFVNDLLLRSCFDFVRNPDFADAIRSRVQLQLDRMHTPDYVQSLTVLDVDVGSSAPSVSNFSSLPSPESNAHMPQIIFDMKYEGNFSITLECKVDIRDAKGWGALDRALDAIEGRPQTPSNAWNGIDAAEIDLLKTVSGFHEDHHPNEVDESTMTPENSRRSLTSFDSFRQGAAQRLRKIADSTAAHISKIPLRVQLTFSSLEGPMCVWIPPPPGDRVFWSFLTPPRLNIAATPQIGDRVFKYAYHASRASQWIEARMKLAFSKNLVFPSGGDFRIPGMLSVDKPIMNREGDNIQVEDTSDSSMDASPASSSSMPSPQMSPSPFFELKLRRKA
jgi:hypothetical protein